MIAKVFVFIVVISAIQALKLPSYIKACKLSDSNFKNCAIKHAQKALQHIANGDATYNVPSLRPLKLTKLILNSRNNLDLEINDAELTGLDRIRFTDFEWNRKARHIKVLVNIDRIEFTGEYKIDGHILILPIQGQGPANITISDGSFVYTADYDLIDKKGKQFANFTTTNLGIKIKRAHIILDNLFNGDPVLAPQMNTFLEENWADVIEEFRKSIGDTFNTIVTTIITGLISRVPYDEIFLA